MGSAVPEAGERRGGGMSRWVDFRELRQGLGIEQVLTSYRVPLKHVGLHQLRGNPRVEAGFGDG